MLKCFDRKLELLNRIETDYLRILYYDFEAMYKGNYKSYEYNRLCTIIDGEKRVKINNGDEITYKSDKFILLPPESNVEMFIEKPTKALVFELNNDLLNKVSDKINYEFNTEVIENKYELFLGNGNDDLHRNINRIIDITNSKESNKEFLIDLHAQELTYNLLKVKGLDRILQLNDNNLPINKVINYINNNIYRSISVKELSKCVDMSESSFSLFFKNTMGVCAKDYIKEVKMIKAMELLKRKNVTEVAYDLGYENISYFIRLFKNKYGLTPKQYIKKNF
ncbi:helix-turn-helix domain-containing protein [Oceanirhabdus sp. W0125-5]|uniref:helix-turn-helix domain-containing protein n=1 Tax=Oceanirhabdus sp. W0125-5 TaxID=2999116 RepID=UPI0022F2D24B|nr:AraC family transcriptional regulator [Oceanirhabdus sp. W0125-5]WBW99158.1 AraC family transcriptional regulator [Oceanirhabdus sp. W0125-5]